VIDSLETLKYARVGEYLLVRVIGRGTQYTLYQAVDAAQGRMVVIKLLHVAAQPEGQPPVDEGNESSAASRESAAVLEARMEREAHALAGLSHPAILDLYGTGEHDGYHYLVMEYLNAHPLRQHLDQRALSLAETVSILEQTAGAIDAVHAQDILHRDIRPSNIMILHDGRVKLVNFGLARQPGDTTVTLMGTIIGEPAYMAPEQFRNQPATRASDLWALGVLLYEMLAGKPPFQGANFTMAAHEVLMAQPAPIDGISPALQSVVDRALEKDPDKRFREGRELVAALRKAVGTVPAAPPLVVQTTKPRYRTLAYAGAAALGLAAYVSVGVHLLHPVVPPLAPLPPITAAPPSAPVMVIPAQPAPAVPLSVASPLKPALPSVTPAPLPTTVPATPPNHPELAHGPL